MNKTTVNSRFTYVIDEEGISKRLGMPVPYPIRVFTLEALGVDQEVFLQDIVPTFSLCPPDLYLVKLSQVNFLKEKFPGEIERLNAFLVRYYPDEVTLEPLFDLIRRLSENDRHTFDRIDVTLRRHRSISKYHLTYLLAPNTWQIERIVPAGALVQRVGPGDPRELARYFMETPNVVSDHPEFRKLMRSIADMVKEIRPGATKLEIGAHQMVVYADALGEANNAPEGIHQDDSDYIVSALVVERAGINGGESIVYAEDKKTELLHWTLEPGCGLFQADSKTSPLWHKVTSVIEDPLYPPPYGNRSIIGFDINIIEEAP